MMNSKKYLFLVAIAFIAFSSSCQQFWHDEQVGQAVRFNAFVEGYFQTRTTYTGQMDETGTKELIKWENGDAVTIYMLSRQEEYSGTYDWITAEYSVDHTTDEGAISHGILSPSESPLQWQGNNETNTEFYHRFYSVYPSNCAKRVEGNDDALSFILPSEQDGKVSRMGYAYMAAANLANKKSLAGPVSLHYYPMVTTIYVTLTNISDKKDINLETISIQSTKGNIAGEYQAILGQRDGNMGFIVDDISYLEDNKVFVSPSQTLYAGSSDVYALFLCPQIYQTEDLQLLINDKVVISSLADNKGKVSELYPYEKYNITLKIDANGETPEPPGLGDLEDPISLHLFFAFIARLNEVSPGLSYFFQNGDQMDWDGYNEMVHFYDEIRNGRREVNNATLVEFYEKFHDAIERILNETTDFEVLSDIGIPLNGDMGPEIFQLFPNLTSIKLRFNADSANVVVKDVQTLTSITVDGNSPVNLTVINCDSFSTLNVNDMNEWAACSFTFDGCDGMEDFYVSKKIHNAVYEFKNSSSLKTITLEGKEIIVENCEVLTTITTSSATITDKGGNPALK